MRIFHDAWLPGSQHGKVFSPAPESHANALVYSLINHEDRSWNVAEIDRVFLPDEAATIKAIPLSLFAQKGLPFWPFSRDGMFSVKSGYHRLMELEDAELNGTAHTRTASPVWKAI